MDTFTPKYVLIQNYIINRINQGVLSLGDRIPSESELSDIFNVSRVTSNKAISELDMMGVVERIRGKGTFVKSTDIIVQDKSNVFSKSFRISSETSELKSHKLVSIEIVAATEEIARKLHLREGEEVTKIVRIMDNIEEPIAIDFSYIPAKLFKGTLPDENVISNCNIHEYLKLYLHQKPRYLNIHINAKRPDSFEMKVLNVLEEELLIVWDTKVIDEGNKILAFTTTIAKPDKYRPYITIEM